MNIHETFTRQLISAPETSGFAAPSEYIGEMYALPDDDRFPVSYQLLSHGAIKAQAPYHYAVHPLNCFLLLYTVKGSATLRLDKQILTLSAEGNNLLLLDCHQIYQMNIASPAWHYHIYLFQSDAIERYRSIFPQPWGAVMNTPPGSDAAMSLESLQLSSRKVSQRAALEISSLLYHIIIDMIRSNYPEESESDIPEYLISIKNLFESSYSVSYTLDELASRFHVSKYRLCREFHIHFGCSPIHYLNRCRISAAKELLLNSNCKVYEAGCRVGIENTNHFISLFKKYSGSTPEQYRKSNSTKK